MLRRDAAELVSVVMPAFNTERFIRRTLASAQAQTYRELEIIVIDDGSTDGTASIVEMAMAEDPRIRLVRAAHGGVAAARNAGIGQARGQLIAPLDADDLWHPEKIERQVELLSRCPADVGLVYCWSDRINEDDAATGSRWSSTRTGKVLEALVMGNFVGCGSVPLIRRTYLEAVGGYDVSLRQAEDWKLYIALAALCRFEVVPVALVGYRQTAASLSTKVWQMKSCHDLLMRWLRVSFPELPREVFSQCACNHDIYLSNVALTNGDILDALWFRGRAYAARPSRLASRSSLRFFTDLLVRVLHLDRLRNSQAGQPKLWEGARSLPPSSRATQTTRSSTAT